MLPMRTRLGRASLALGTGLCLALGLACGGSESTPDSATARPPNLVLLIGDDHGFRDFGFMGREEIRTPHLDRLASEGVVFPKGYSTSSLCRPALRTLLTGLQPIQYGRAELEVRAQTQDLNPERVVEAIDTLPRLLGEHGYASFQAGKYAEGHFAAAGFDDGMVEEFGSRGLRDASRLVRETVDPVLDFVTEHADQPFFLWFAPKLPHMPHNPPARLVELYADGAVPKAEVRYAASITWFDEGVGQLLEHLEANGLREHTLVVYLSDNGWDTSPAEAPEHFTLGGPQGKKSLYELGFRTPIVLSQPGTLAPARIDALVSSVDVFPTLLDYAGIATPAGRTGHSLRTLVEGGDGPRTTLVGWTHAIRNSPPPRITGGYFWRSDRWHFLQPQGLPVELYDVVADPFEQHDRSRDHAEVVAEATRAIRAWAGGLPEVPLRLESPSEGG